MQPKAIAEGFPKPRDMGLEALRRAPRRVPAVQILDQPIRWDDFAPVHQQDRDKPSLFGSEGDCSAVVFDLEVTENAKVHRRRRNRL